jgi:hypothetical protein
VKVVKASGHSRTRPRWVLLVPTRNRLSWVTCRWRAGGIVGSKASRVLGGLAGQEKPLPRNCRFAELSCVESRRMPLADRPTSGLAEKGLVRRQTASAV